MTVSTGHWTERSSQSQTVVRQAHHERRECFIPFGLSLGEDITPILTFPHPGGRDYLRSDRQKQDQCRADHHPAFDDSDTHVPPTRQGLGDLEFGQ